MIADDTTADDTERENLYREAAVVYTRLVNSIGAFLVESKSPRVGIWAVNYALGLAVCEGVSVTNRATQLGVTPQALSKQVKKFQAENDLKPSPYMYKK